MKPKRPYGFGLLVSGLVILVIAVGNLVQGPPNVPVGRWLFVVSIEAVAGALLVGWGCTMLRKEKAQEPERSWSQFLGDDLIAVGLVVAFMVGIGCLPESWREGMKQTFHDLHLMLHLRPGH